MSKLFISTSIKEDIQNLIKVSHINTYLSIVYAENLYNLIIKRISSIAQFATLQISIDPYILTLALYH